MMRSLALPTLLVALCAQGQWDVPVPVVLNGSTAQQRQVLGLADPVDSTSAVSLAAARDNASTYALATGNVVLAADLAPAPTVYTTGMVVHILPQQANDQGALLDLNGLGPRPIAKQGGLPLDSADLFPGVPARLVYDGNMFILLGSTYLPCRTGFKAVAREFCIEDSSHAAVNFYDAVQTCTQMGARLCTFSEWTHACRSIPDFMGTVPSYEWVDSAANNARQVPSGSWTFLRYRERHPPGCRSLSSDRRCSCPGLCNFR